MTTITATFVKNTINITMLGGMGRGNFLQSGEGEPMNVVTPKMIGSEYIDELTGDKYFARSMDAGSRVKINYDLPG